MNGRFSLLLLLMVAHGLVDVFASLIQPLWPDLQGALALEPGAIQWAYVTWSLATSVSQLFFGYWGDRYRRRWLIWAGPALGVVCLSSIGLVHSLPMLNVLLVVGGLGIAAFHPEAAALAGASTPGDRSRAMSLFAVGGSLGQAFGPIYGGVITTQFGLRALAWSMTWGLVVLGLLGLGLRRHPDEPDAARTRAVPSTGASLLRDRGRRARAGAARSACSGSSRCWACRSRWPSRSRGGATPTSRSAWRRRSSWPGSAAGAWPVPCSSAGPASAGCSGRCRCPWRRSSGLVPAAGFALLAGRVGAARGACSWGRPCRSWSATASSCCPRASARPARSRWA